MSILTLPRGAAYIIQLIVVFVNTVTISKAEPLPPPPSQSHRCLWPHTGDLIVLAACSRGEVHSKRFRTLIPVFGIWSHCCYHLGGSGHLLFSWCLQAFLGSTPVLWTESGDAGQLLGWYISSLGWYISSSGWYISSSSMCSMC